MSRGYRVPRPLGLARALEAALRGYRGHFAAIVGSYAFYAVPVAIVTVLMSVVDEGVWRNRYADDPFELLFWWVMPGYPVREQTIMQVCVGIRAVWWLFSGWFIGAATVAAVNGYLGRKITTREALSHGRRVMWSFLGISFLGGLCIYVGLAMCILPGLWLLVAYSVAFPAVVVERAGGAGAIKRSFGLAHGAFWPLCGKVLMWLVMFLIISECLPLLPSFFYTGDPSLWALVAARVLSEVGGLLLLPLMFTTIVVLYFDQRARTEGLDLLTASNALDDEATDGRPTR